MYNLNSPINRSLDRFKIKDWCMKNLSPSEFWRYLNLSDSERQVFDEKMWDNQVSKFLSKRIEGEDEDPGDEYWPSSELEWESVEGREHSGPGLATIINLDFSDPEADIGYSETLSFWSERSLPWVANNEYSHYNPSEWNESNDSLVRIVKERRKLPEDYNQLLLGMSLV